MILEETLVGDEELSDGPKAKHSRGKQTEQLILENNVIK